MADWETIVNFANANNQVMTARWANRILNNLSWCYDYALYGSSPWRIIKHAAIADGTTWETAWRGTYYHVNATLGIVYSMIRETTTTEGAPLNYHFAYDYDNKWHQNITPRYDHLTYDSEYKVELYYGGSWHSLITDSIIKGAGNKDEVDVSASASLTGLGLTLGGFYPLRVQARNGGICISRLAVVGSASYSYTALPTVTDGQHLHYNDWNIYPGNLLYLKQLVDTPRGPTWGVGNGTTGRSAWASGPTWIWRGAFSHSGGKYLKWRVGGKHTGLNFTIKIYYNGTLLEASPGCGYTYSEGGGGPTYYNGYHDISNHGLTPGTWYDVAVSVTSTGADSDLQGWVDYMFESDGEPAAALACSRTQHGNYVLGDHEAGMFNMADLNADFATVKAAADKCVQIPPPDIATESGTWPTPESGAGTYLPNDLSYTRQRTTLLWSANVGSTEEIVLYYGDGTSPPYERLGVGVTSGTLDLRTISGITVGIRYWLTPREHIIYAFEV